MYNWYNHIFFLCKTIFIKISQAILNVQENKHIHRHRQVIPIWFIFINLLHILTTYQFSLRSNKPFLNYKKIYRQTLI